MPRDTSILSGKWGWLWQCSDFKNGADDVISLAKSMGYRGIVVKSADGDQEWTQFQECLPKLKAAGLEVGAWIFNYGDDPEGESKAVIDALNQGAAFVCLDVENQYANKRDAAVKMGQLIRSAKPDALITFAPWCMVDEGIWSSVPYADIAQYCDAVQPQNYWSDYVPTCDVGLKQSDAELKKFGLPIYPIGQTYPGDSYTPVSGDYDLFEKTCHELGYTGVSFWRLGSENDEMKAAVAKMQFPVVQPSASAEETKYPLSVDDANKVIGLLKAAYNIVQSDEWGRLGDVMRELSGQPKQNS